MNYNSIKRFTNRADYYNKYRPMYPIVVADFIISEFKLSSDSIIADIGCGTGIFSSLFKDRIKTIYGIEPNTEMLKFAKKNLSKQKNFIPINATYEKTTLKNSSVNAIVCAQAFHWFNINKAKNEFKRITDSNNFCALIWNIRNTENPFFAEYENILCSNIKNYPKRAHNKNYDKMSKSLFKNYKKEIFDNYIDYDFDSICGLLKSSSYVPLKANSYNKIFEEIQIIFNKYCVNNIIKLHFKTHVYSGIL